MGFLFELGCLIMGNRRYALEPENPTKSVKAKGSNLRVHFKNTHETAQAIKGMKLTRAKAYLNAVLNHKECIPFRYYMGSTGRTAQAKQFGTTTGRWPKKSCQYILQLLQNAESNAEVKRLNVKQLVVSHIQVNMAQVMRRRTYRAHGHWPLHVPPVPHRACPHR